MVKTLSLKKLFELPKFKMKKSERVYDKEWHMFFPCEEARLEFRERIAQAEKNIEEGNYYTQEEVERILKNEYGIIL